MQATGVNFLGREGHKRDLGLGQGQMVKSNTVFDSDTLSPTWEAFLLLEDVVPCLLKVFINFASDELNSGYCFLPTACLSG